jgi:xylitol oxidase
MVSVTDDVSTPTTIRSNWAGNLEYRAARLLRPTTLEEVREAVTAGGPVRAVGSRHCFNDIADTTGTHLSLESFEPVDASTLTVDTDADGATTVTVSGGARYGDLATALYAHGYAVPNLASLPHISVAGAIATATHGSGVTNQGLGGAVVALEIVTATGEVLTVRRGEDDGALPFDAAVVHLGALGVVTRVTLAVEPTFDVRQDVFVDLPWEAFERDADAVLGAAYSVSVFTTWRDDAMDQVWLKSRVDEIETRPGGALALGEDFHGARRSPVPLHPLPGISAESCTEQLGVAGPAHERLAHFKMDFTPSNGDELQSEYIVPREHAVAAVAAVRALREQIVPLLQVTEIRTMAADGFWLSPSGAQDSVGIHFTWLQRQPEVEALLPVIEAALAPFDARPHWGKLFTTDAARLAELYPRLPELRALAARLDPEGVLRNDYLDRVLG